MAQTELKFDVPAPGQPDTPAVRASYKAGAIVAGKWFAQRQIELVEKTHAVGALTERMADHILAQVLGDIDANCRLLEKAGHAPRMIGIFRAAVIATIRKQIKRRKSNG